MNVYPELVRMFKSIEVDPNHMRESRAIIMAQLLAYDVPIKCDDSAAGILARYTTCFKAVINHVNEFTPVDPKLTLALVESLLETRLEVLTGALNPTLMAYILSSDTQASQFNPEQRQTLTSVLSQSDVRVNIRQFVENHRGFTTEEVEDA